ncbi:nicotinamide mononucleotide transporter [Ottowia sp.]|uniref:nicotinamide mononucleotide transporter n=1 Tax=Ottowia sp. TaxID=1898956 RepID=UPI003A872CDE
MSALQYLEAASATLGVLGALLLATRHRWAPWAWVMWLASNAGWIAFGIATQHWGLVAQNSVFAATSGIGVWHWLIRPGTPKKKKPKEST